MILLHGIIMWVNLVKSNRPLEELETYLKNHTEELYQNDLFFKLLDYNYNGATLLFLDYIKNNHKNDYFYAVKNKKNGYSILSAALARRNFTVVLYILENFKIDLNSVDNFGRNFLYQLINETELNDNLKRIYTYIKENKSLINLNQKNSYTNNNIFCESIEAENLLFMEFLYNLEDKEFDWNQITEDGTDLFEFGEETGSDKSLKLLRKLKFQYHLK